MTRRDPRSFVLPATLVAIVLITLAAMGVATVADVESEGVRADAARVQARALAWSGVQCLIAELNKQRPELIAGRSPTVSGEWTIIGSASSEGERGVARLLDRDGQPLRSELARVDANIAGRAKLLALGLRPEAADALIAGRARRRYSSAEEAAAVFAERPMKSDTDLPSERSGADQQPSELLTVFAAGPVTQMGVGPGGTSFAGKPRLSLAAAWSEQLQTDLRDRLGQEAGMALAEQLRTGGPMKTHADLARWLVSRSVPPADWSVYFDATTPSSSRFEAGRVDLNRAPGLVLAAIPGFDAAIAERIVQRRRALDPSVLASVCWPLTESLLTPEQFAQAVDYLTTRSMVWRGTIEAGFLTGRTEPGSSPLLRHRICYEVVVDLVGSTPRLAYLRDISSLAFASRPDLQFASAEANDGPEEPVAEPPAPAVVRTPEPQLTAPAASSKPRETSHSNRAEPAQPPRIGRWTAGSPAAREDPTDAAAPGGDQY